MAAELVETSRLWGRIAARIEPEWAERLAGHLVKRSYSEPHWEADQGSVMAVERVTLYGLPLVVGRKVHYGRIDPVLSRELFLRHALVEGDWKTRHEFFHANRALLDEVEELEAPGPAPRHRGRRRDPVRVLRRPGRRRGGLGRATSTAGGSGSAAPTRTCSRSRRPCWSTPGGRRLDRTDYPDTWRQGELALPLTYQFEPGTAADGVTVHIPLPVLNQVTPGRLRLADPRAARGPRHRADPVPAQGRCGATSCPVPGLRRPRCSTVPRPARRAAARRAGDRTCAGSPACVIPGGDWDAGQGARPPADHVPGRGRRRRRRRRGQGPRRATRASSPRRLAGGGGRGSPRTSSATGLTAVAPRARWPRWCSGAGPATQVTAYPALVDETDSVAVRVFETEAEQARAMWAGTRRLLLLEVPTPIPVLSQAADQRGQARAHPLPVRERARPARGLRTGRGRRHHRPAHGGPAFDDAGYARLREAARAELPDTTVETWWSRSRRSVAAAHDVRSRLAAPAPPALAAVH